MPAKTMFHLSIQPELLRKLKARARTDGMTATAWVTLLLRSALADLKAGEPSAFIALKHEKGGRDGSR